ncbi:Mannose-6-phosphate isomerase, cupin superfamily [Halobiforma haloterrestris]|uniref:Mannose-6-phosphate isomerase, cupin superfamily n=1 Tax=Natronobacterium haloterrestre TaxID=148448 RepID=A0A1I1E303_NATHA|nr:cupin domain-containing protein [Halobiforma haloterrestris]SFB79320.1 Mannose-6-phosphate isomerase, cupin superfamily [Halobiforma haloterrestris]
MERLSIDDLEPDPYDDDLHTDRRDLTGPLSLANVSVVRYALEPGERFSGAAHAHPDQEEVFVVLEGEATFEVGQATDDGGPRTVTVGENEAIRFAPGEFQTGGNDADDERLVALGLGAPRESGDVLVDRIPVLDEGSVTCPDCGHEHLRIGEDGLVCPECGATTTVEE